MRGGLVLLSITRIINIVVIVVLRIVIVSWRVRREGIVVGSNDLLVIDLLKQKLNLTIDLYIFWLSN